MWRRKEIFTNYLKSADIHIGRDIEVINDRFFHEVYRGSIGIGEAWQKGYWTASAVDNVLYKLLMAKVPAPFGMMVLGLPAFVRTSLEDLRDRYLLMNRAAAAAWHYNWSNELYQRMLGPTMAYTCGLWTGATTLDEAQVAKFELIARKLQLEPGMTVLDMGGGWGELARYLARVHGARVVSCTVSEEQWKWAVAHSEGLPVEYLLLDYRALDPNMKFDRIVTVGMLEHLGLAQHRTYMQAVRCHLKPQGIALLHTISQHKSGISYDSWMRKYMFPGALIPSLKQIASAAEGTLMVEDLQILPGTHYDQTLMAWWQNIADWDGLTEWERRTLEFYLRCCAASFRAGKMHIVHIVFSNYRPDGYVGIR